MADPITREQVERAITAAEYGYMDPWESYFGDDWRDIVPRYVLIAYGDDCDGWETVTAALTRWRDELAAAEPAEDSPERLRERREALGLSRQQASNLAAMMPACYVAILEEESRDDAGGAAIRSAYAAALSAAEAERPAKPDPLAYADSPAWDDWPMPKPTPERPAPRFKVGDWVRVVTGPNSTGRINPIRVTCVTSAGYIMADGASWAAEHITPAIDPALHETARKTVAWLRSCRGGWADGYEARKALPGHREWDLEHKDNERWAAHLERLLGDAP